MLCRCIANEYARSLLYSVIEPCTHEIQYAGMCANCGKDLTGGDYLGNGDASRATVAMSHDTLGLTVSYSEAARLERETTKRLIQTSKLSLIVDLDQCVIQTTVDPTVGEWLQDAENPNHAALLDVQHFTIAEEGPRAPTYFVKPRPRLQQFLASMSKKFEMHIYTMGTKPYALKIASVIDPDGRYFGSRILSRDENGSNTQKTIQRLFPVETNMVVIIDDRGDVWQWSPNLIKVNPFEFFVGIGDINSSFLPKLETGPPPREVQAKLPTSTKASLNAYGQLPAVLGTPELEAAQAATLDAQVEERPLAKQQEALESNTKASNVSNAVLLHNGDDELMYLERALRRLHEEFYSTYNAKIGEVTRERNLAKLNKTRPRKRSRGAAADVKSILADQKRVVLQGVVVLFSGIIRSDLDPRREWQGQLAIQYGARVLDSKSKEKPTHVVVGRDVTTSNLTEKARMAKTSPWIKVVYLKWLTDSITRFEKQPEKEYQVDKNAPDVPRPDSDPANSILDDASSDIESVITDYGQTDRFIDEAAKNMDWTDLQGEMDDFLGDISDDATTEASDNDSDSSTGSRASSKKSRTDRRVTSLASRHKRMRSLDANSDGEYSNDDRDPKSIDLLRSPLSKRRNVAKQRRSGLAHSVAVGPDTEKPVGLGLKPTANQDSGGRGTDGTDVAAISRSERIPSTFIKADGSRSPNDNHKARLKNGMTENHAVIDTPGTKLDRALQVGHEDGIAKQTARERDSEESRGDGHKNENWTSTAPMDTASVVSSDFGSELDDLANALELQLEEE